MQNNLVRHKIIRTTTVPISLRVLLKGQLRFMRENGFEVIGVSSEGEDLTQVQQEEEVSIAPIEMTRVISPIQDLRSLWQFYKLCKRERPSIVHSHTPKAGIVAMLGAKLAGVPIRLHTVAGLPLMEATGIKRKILNLIEKLTYWCATKVYPNSQGLCEFILNNKFTRTERLQVIANGSSNGIDTDFFSVEQLSEEHIAKLQEELGLNESDFVFIFVGRLVGDKGVNELIAAFKETNRWIDEENRSLGSSARLRTPKLLLVGALESDLDPLLPQTLQEIHTNSDIISVGFQKDVRSYFALSDALVFPSYREGFPNVVMQAGAMGLPSIVSDINGCNEIIVEGENGTIVPVKNTEKLVEAMKRFLGEDEYYAVLQQKARDMVAARYEQKVVWQALLTEYHDLLRQKRLLT